MRVLQLRKDGLALDLHPYVSVVQGLSPATREQIVGALAAIPAGRDPGITGVLEAYGILLDLDPDNLSLLGLATDLPVVVRADDLPRGGDAGDRAAVAARAEAELDLAARRRDLDAAAVALAAARAALDAEASGRTDETSAASDPVDDAAHRALEDRRSELDRLRAERVDAEARLLEARAEQTERGELLIAARRQVDEARDRRQAAAEACSMAAGELEAARTGRDPFAASALAAAREHLAELEREEAGEGGDGGGAPGAEEVDPAGRIGELEARRPDVEAALLAIDALDRFPVESALAALEDAPPTELVPDSEALALADRWAATAAVAGDDAEVDADADADRTGGDVVADARRRLDRARSAVFDAEQALRQPDLDRAGIDELERVHAVVLAAGDKADRRFRGKRAQEQLEAARAEERKVLDRLGISTYADYVMGTSMQRVDPEGELRLDLARQVLLEAEEEWAALQATGDAELNRAARIEERRAIRAAARDLLGRDPGDDVEWALRQHRVSIDSVDRRARELRAALERAGLVLGDERFERHELIDLARVWLAEEADTTARRRLLERELADLDAELALLRERLPEPGSDGTGAVAPADADARRRSRRAEARAALAAAEERVAHNAAAEVDVEGCLAVLDWASADERDAARRLVEAELGLAVASAADQDASGAVAALEERTVQAEAAQRLAEDDLAALEERLATSVAAPDGRTSLAAATHAERERRLADAQADRDAAAAAVTEAEAMLTQPAPDAGEEQPVADEIEWFLLARLAAQRSVSFAGSVPLVLDAALDGLPEAELRRILERLERMAASVQIVLVSDDPSLALWADMVGPDRAAVVSPSNQRFDGQL